MVCNTPYDSQSRDIEQKFHAYRWENWVADRKRGKKNLLIIVTIFRNLKM